MEIYLMISNPHQPLLTRTAAPLSCPLACVGWLLTLVLTSLPATGQLVINEIVANNKNTIDDVDGESSDWIEILNTGSQLNLGGYSLTDDPAVPGKWTFPGGQFLGPNSYLVVFASGKDRAVLGQQLHTNFSLESDGEYLALCDPGGTVIHEFAPSFPNLKRDIGYGIGSDGTPGYLFPTTPNGANGNHLTGFVADTVFSHQRGFYDDPIEVIISSTTPGVSIRYTTNGREPTPSHGQIYTGPVTITSTTILRAVAYRTDMVPTNVDAKSYLYTQDIIEQSNMISSVVNSTAYRNEIQSALKEIPVVSLSFNRTALFGTRGIHNLPSLSGSTSEREAHFEYFDPPNPDDSTQEPAGIRIHGGNARQHPKKNFRLYFRSDYGKTRLDHNLFPESPVDSFKSILLRGGGHDAWTFRDDWNNASLIRNEFLHRLQQDMGQPSPYGRMVSLFLNGDY
ncbi:MAG: chitobiase/beta-hexosaminidase C-terminal domain-containing protein, partial [Verrucomicrobiota bacterium]|nr:chitobiase/beta-hexosaminidase C-terminal domain-containing protein [Verrucomicrobiota bacterium]